MTLQKEIVHAAANGLTATENTERSDRERGMRVYYDSRSWFIHANSLAERTEYVIGMTGKTFICDSAKAKQMTNRHKQEVKKQVTKIIEKSRNEFAHGTKRVDSGASGITKDQLWEASVSVSMLPPRILSEFTYPLRGQFLMNGKYNRFVDVTEKILVRLGKILQDFEQDLMTNYKLKCRMGALG